MSFSITVRFSKNDNYSNPVFICSPKNAEEKGSYTKLCLLSQKISESDINTFSPIYHNTEHEFATIRFKHYKGIKLEQQGLYNINCVLKRKESNDKVYINAFVNNISLLKKATPRDDGEVMDFGNFLM